MPPRSKAQAVVIPEDEEDDSNQEEQERSSFGAGDEDFEDAPPLKRARTGRASSSSAKDLLSPGSQTSGSRHDCSLALLTKNFISLMDESPNGTLDRNTAADTLKVKKRRIYDITNVLEGVGLLQKKTKNVVEWIGGPSACANPEQQQELDEIAADNKELEEMEKALEEQISLVSKAMEAVCSNAANKERLYVTDVLVRSLPCFSSDTVFAMRAPSGTTMQLMEPNGHDFMLKVSSEQGAIEVYLVHHAEDVTPCNNEAAAAAQPSNVPQQQQHAGRAPLLPSLTTSPMNAQNLRGMHPTQLISPRNGIASHLLATNFQPGSMHHQPFSPLLKPEPFTPPAIKNDLTFAGASPFGPVSAHFQAFGGGYGEFDVNAWTNPSSLALFEAFGDDYKQDELNLDSQMLRVG